MNEQESKSVRIFSHIRLVGAASLIVFSVSGCVTEGASSALNDASTETPADVDPNDAVVDNRCINLGKKFLSELGGDSPTRKATDAEKAQGKKMKEICCVEPRRSRLSASGAGGLTKKEVDKLCDELLAQMEAAIAAYEDGDYETLFAIIEENPEVLARFLVFLAGVDGKSDATTTVGSSAVMNTAGSNE